MLLSHLSCELSWWFDDKQILPTVLTYELDQLWTVLGGLKHRTPFPLIHLNVTVAVSEAPLEPWSSREYSLGIPDICNFSSTDQDKEIQKAWRLIEQLVVDTRLVRIPAFWFLVWTFPGEWGWSWGLLFHSDSFFYFLFRKSSESFFYFPTLILFSAFSSEKGMNCFLFPYLFHQLHFS